MPQADLVADTGEKDYFCRDQGFAAYLATKFLFLGAVDTGQPMPRSDNTIKEFQFVIPADHNIEADLADYSTGSDNSLVPAQVMFNKLRLMRQACRKPVPMGAA